MKLLPFLIVLNLISACGPVKKNKRRIENQIEVIDHDINQDENIPDQTKRDPDWFNNPNPQKTFLN